MSIRREKKKITLSPNKTIQLTNIKYFTDQYHTGKKREQPRNSSAIGSVTGVNFCSSVADSHSPKKYKWEVKNSLLRNPKSDFLSLFFSQRCDLISWMWITVKNWGLFCRISHTAEPKKTVQRRKSTAPAGLSPAEYSLCRRCGQQLPSTPPGALIHYIFFRIACQTVC